MAKGSVLDEYLSQLSKSLDCPRARKKQILEEVKLSLLEIPRIHELTLDEIIASEGSPEEVALSYQENLAPNALKHIRRKRIFRIALVSVMLLAVVLLGIYIADALSYSHGTYSESPAYSGTPVDQEGNSYVEIY